ncbi:MAG: DUF1587 domain-containing protein, partial [Pirellulaceae bacterium]|nr:DUF1587 domain-containing protein [Pirellulaceae bacterium]
MNCRTLVIDRVHNWGRAACLAGVWSGLVLLAQLPPAPAGEPNGDALGRTYEQDVRPLVRQYCHACHSAQLTEAEIDFEPLASFAEAGRHARTWERVAEVVNGSLMPPTDAPQPTADERGRLQAWLRAFLTAEARSRAGDPGPVVLRRLSNAEYTYTLRDLTGVPTLDPAREFPVDGAAGEGFTNAGNALVMSPTLVTKYLDAAKEVAGHAVLLPDGFRFSPHTTRADWTNDALAHIRAFYGRFTDSAGGNTVNLQGIVFDTNQGGRLPVEQYLAATLAERAALTRGEKTLEAVAQERGLSAKYLGGLWKMLMESRPGPAAAAAGPETPSLLLDGLRTRWRAAEPKDVPTLAADIARWQQALWRFTSVGHIGKLNGPKAWMEPVDPFTARQDFNLKLPVTSGTQPRSTDSADVVLYLAAGDAGDGNARDFVVWDRPRLVAPGRPDVLLRDVGAVTSELAARRAQLTATAAQCLGAAAEASAAQGELNVNALAQRYGVAAESLSAWLDYLGVVAAGSVKRGPLIERKSEASPEYDFIKGWVGDDALSVLANSSDQLVRIPGTMKPHSIAVHPSPKRSVAVGWRSPVAASLRITGSVQHAHPDCGNGIAWSLELRRGRTTQRLASGTNQAGPPTPFGPLDQIVVRPGNVVALVVNPRDSDHSCDLTSLDLTLTDGSRQWNLARDLSPNILAGNPHQDGLGNADVWHFFSEPASGSPEQVIPAGSLLARWQAAGSPDEQRKLADELQQLLRDGVGTRPPDAPDSRLYQQLTALGGPLMSTAWRVIAARPPAAASGGNSSDALDPALFGKHPSGGTAGSVDSASLCVQAPSVIEVRLPAYLAADAEFVTAGTLHA